MNSIEIFYRPLAETDFCAVFGSGGFICEGVVSPTSDQDYLVILYRPNTYVIDVEKIHAISYRKATRDELETHSRSSVEERDQ
jgi:hypothetical protein